MKTNFIILVSLLITFASCTTTKVIVRKYSPGAKNEGISYYLPKTVLEVGIGYTITYDLITYDNQTFDIANAIISIHDSVNVTPRTVPDIDHHYIISNLGKGSSTNDLKLDVSLSEAGILKSISAESENKGAEIFKAAVGTLSSLAKTSKNIAMGGSGVAKEQNDGPSVVSITVEKFTSSIRTFIDFSRDVEIEDESITEKISLANKHIMWVSKNGKQVFQNDPVIEIQIEGIKKDIMGMGPSLINSSQDYLEGIIIRKPAILKTTVYVKESKISRQSRDFTNKKLLYQVYYPYAQFGNFENIQLITGKGSKEKTVLNFSESGALVSYKLEKTSNLAEKLGSLKDASNSISDEYTNYMRMEYNAQLQKLKDQKTLIDAKPDPEKDEKDNELAELEKEIKILNAKKKLEQLKKDLKKGGEDDKSGEEE